MKAFEEVSIIKFLFGKEWISLSGKYRLFPLISGTLRVTFVALEISIPINIINAAYIFEYASKKTRDIFNLNTGITALTGGILLSFMAIPTMVSTSML